MERGGTTPDASNGAPWEWLEFERVLGAAAARPASILHVIGEPGGLLHLADGRIVDAWTVGTPLAVPSPVAPVNEGTKPRVSRPLKIVAIVDMLFAMAAGRVYGVREELGSSGSSTGIELHRALREVNRRLAVLSAGGAWPPLRAESQPRRTLADRPPTSLLTESEGAVFGLVGVGTTVRDIAFLLGRGLYAVALDVAHLVEVGLVEIAMPAPPAATQPAGSHVSFMQASGRAADTFARRRPRPTVPRTPAADHPPPELLTRRIPGASGIQQPRETQA
jgi:hypothetical protein